MNEVISYFNVKFIGVSSPKIFRTGIVSVTASMDELKDIVSDSLTFIDCADKKSEKERSTSNKKKVFI
jgi:hypothetical protein